MTYRIPTQKRYSDFIVQVVIKENLGVFGIKRGPVHEFRFCAEFGTDAGLLAAQNVPYRGFACDITAEVRVVNSLPVFRADIEQARLASIMRRTDHLDPIPMTHVERLNPTGTEMHERTLRDCCAWCGSKSETLDSCYCRKCPSCGDYWRASELMDLSDGTPAIVECAECEEREESGAKDGE